MIGQARRASKQGVSDRKEFPPVTFARLSSVDQPLSSTSSPVFDTVYTNTIDKTGTINIGPHRATEVRIAAPICTITGELRYRPDYVKIQAEGSVEEGWHNLSFPLVKKPWLAHGTNLLQLAPGLYRITLIGNNDHSLVIGGKETTGSIIIDFFELDREQGLSIKRFNYRQTDKISQLLIEKYH